MRENAEGFEDEREGIRDVEYHFPFESVPAHEDGSDDRSARDGAHDAPNAHLPCLFTFSCSGIDPCHEKDNVQRCRDVEDLESEVPEAEEAMEVAEQVEVPYNEDKAIQCLSDEGYTLSTLVCVNGPYQNTLAHDMAYVAEYSKWIQKHIVDCEETMVMKAFQWLAVF